ncbi:MAG: Fic family protein [Verrucomicrobiales bacterium]|nr:Fic family protein [Verrucomicrobiales bacterium]
MPTPPYTITPAILDLLTRIAEEVGRLGLGDTSSPASRSPQLRRKNRIKSIHASLAIENNTLSLEQVTALIEGKRVLGPPKEVQEVKNAFAAYEGLAGWSPYRIDDLLRAHALMMDGLVDRPGAFRSGGVGIAKGKTVVHLAPPAEMVTGLMNDLLKWLKETDAHPLIASCVFHYELEFIHPFADGNGRVGRLWQTLILSQWKAPLAYLPIEDIIRKRQNEYYDTLAACDKVGNSTQLIEFLLTALLEALTETLATDQVSDQVSDQVKLLLKALESGPLSALDCMGLLHLSHRPTFRKNYLNPALEAKLIERTIPDKPRSQHQRYKLSEK